MTDDPPAAHPRLLAEPGEGRAGRALGELPLRPGRSEEDSRRPGSRRRSSCHYHQETATDLNSLLIDSINRTGNFALDVVTYGNSVAYRDCGRAITARA